MMKDLFFSEIRRFRNAAVIFALVHLLSQLFVYRVSDILQMRWQEHVVGLALFMLAGIGFALYQFGTYRQPGRWVWLLHRPLPPAAIFGAIGLASAALIMFAVGLPALATVLGTEWLTGRTVDLRHYLLVLHLVLLTMIAWLAGTCVILSHSRSAFVILLLPLLMLAHLASGFALLAPTVACLALLAFVAYGSFKANRTAPPHGTAKLFAMALPLQVGFYFALLWGGSGLYQVAGMLAGTHALNQPVPPAGGYIELHRTNGREAFALGLAASSHPRAEEWRRQLAGRGVGFVLPLGRQHPVRHQISNLDRLGWIDGANRREWTFSHDSMRFHARDIHTGAPRGVLGLGSVGDGQPFPSVPVLPGANLIVTRQQVFEMAPDTLAVRRLMEVTGNETLSAPPKPMAGSYYALSNERLIVLGDNPANPGGMLRNLYSIALPGSFSDLNRIDVAKLPDGTLLSFNFGRTLSEGAGESRQVLMFVDPVGNAQPVAQRVLVHDFPLLFQHKDWWLSPLLHTALALPEALLDKGLILDRGLTSYTNQLERERPRPVVITAVLVALLAALAGWQWMRGLPISTRRKAGWTAACLLLGPPSVLCLMVLQPRPPRLKEHPALVPA